MRQKELIPILDQINNEVDQPDFIHSDPVQFMHAFDDFIDKEIAGFFAAIMAWGRRDIVINKVDNLLNRMDYQPKAFILQLNESSFEKLEGFKHRTFKPEDIYWISLGLKRIIEQYGNLENAWIVVKQRSNSEHFVQEFHEFFFSHIEDAPTRTRKHISDGRKNSTCKRLLLYLKWAVRKNSFVDVGMYSKINPSELVIPFDVHVARIARQLKLLKRKQNDWKAVMELQKKLKRFDPKDPTKYDFALFGIGVLGLDVDDYLNI